MDVRDNAQAAACALTESGHEGKIYTLTGPQALTHARMAERLRHSLGKTVEFVDISPDEMRTELLTMHMPPWQVDGLTMHIKADTVTDGAEAATGHAARDFTRFAADYARLFS